MSSLLPSFVLFLIKVEFVKVDDFHFLILLSYYNNSFICLFFFPLLCFFLSIEPELLELDSRVDKDSAVLSRLGFLNIGMASL